MEFFTGQRRTIDLSAGSFCPPLIRHNIHHSSAVHQARVSRKSGELWNVLLSSCRRGPLLSFLSSLPLSVIWKWRCSHASIKIIDGHPTRWDVDILNNWLASKHSFCNHFLLISNSPAYLAPSVIALFICILQFGYWKKLWIRSYLKQPTYWIVFFSPLPAYFHSSGFVSTGDGCCFSQWWTHIVIPDDPTGRLLCCVVHTLDSPPSDTQHLCAVRSLLMLVL